LLHFWVENHMKCAILEEAASQLRKS